MEFYNTPVDWWQSKHLLVVLVCLFWGSSLELVTVLHHIGWCFTLLHLVLHAVSDSLCCTVRPSVALFFPCCCIVEVSPTAQHRALSAGEEAALAMHQKMTGGLAGCTSQRCSSRWWQCRWCRRCTGWRLALYRCTSPTGWQGGWYLDAQDATVILIGAQGCSLMIPHRPPPFIRIQTSSVLAGGQITLSTCQSCLLILHSKSFSRKYKRWDGTQNGRVTLKAAMMLTSTLWMNVMCRRPSLESVCVAGVSPDNASGSSGKSTSEQQADSGHPDSPDDDGLGPLPPNWEKAYTEKGEPYFIDHNSGEFPLFQNVMLATSPSKCSLFSFVVLVKVSAKTFSSNFACEYEFDKGPAPLFSKKIVFFKWSVIVNMIKSQHPLDLAFCIPVQHSPAPPHQFTAVQNVQHLALRVDVSLMGAKKLDFQLLQTGASR